MSKKQKQSWNLLKPRSFDMYKNIAVSMIIILGHLEVDTKILNIDMKIIRSNNYKELLDDDENVNSVLVTM